MEKGPSVSHACFPANLVGISPQSCNVIWGGARVPESDAKLVSEAVVSMGQFDVHTGLSINAKLRSSQRNGEK